MEALAVVPSEYFEGALRRGTILRKEATTVACTSCLYRTVLQDDVQTAGLGGCLITPRHQAGSGLRGVELDITPVNYNMVSNWSEQVQRVVPW